MPRIVVSADPQTICLKNSDKLYQTILIDVGTATASLFQTHIPGSAEMRAAPPLGTAGPTSRIVTRLNLGHTSLPERPVAKGLPVR